MKIEWKPDGDEFAAHVTRESDDTNIRVSLMPPGSEFNDGPGWSYSIMWDTGEDPDIAYEAHIMGDVVDRMTAEVAVEVALAVALHQGKDDEDVKAAIIAELNRRGLNPGVFVGDA